MHLTSTIHRSAGIVHNNLQREVYHFATVDGFALRLMSYELQTRPTSRHKWIPSLKSAYYVLQRGPLKRDEVLVPESVIAQALKEIREEFAAKLKWEAT